MTDNPMRRLAVEVDCYRSSGRSPADGRISMSVPDAETILAVLRAAVEWQPELRIICDQLGMSATLRGVFQLVVVDAMLSGGPDNA